MADETTQRGYPLPNPDNIARDDASRIRTAIVAISDDLTDLENRNVIASESEAGSVRLATAAEVTAASTSSAVPTVRRTSDMISAALAATQTALTQLQAAVAANMAANDAEVDRAIVDLNASIAAQIADYNTTLNGKSAKSENLADLTDKDAARNNINAQIKGNYQAALGFTPVNAAGDTITGGLTVNGTISSPNWAVSPRSQRYADVADFGPYATMGQVNNFVVHCRFVHAGDAQDNGSTEIGGACLTAAYVYTDEWNGAHLWKRYRYLQYYIPNIGYATFVWN